MNGLLKIIWMVWGQHLLVREAKRRTLALYLRALRAGRLSVLALLVTFLILQLMIISLLGAVVTGIYLWDHDFQAKMQILFWIFTGTFLVPVLLLSVLMSERLWLRLSGAHKLMDDGTTR